MRFRSRPCGYKECASAIHSSGQYRTHGRGNLDADNHWEIPCRTCAAAADERLPFIVEETRAILQQNGTPPEMIEEYIQNTGWLNSPSWPFAPAVEAAMELSSTREATAAV